MRWWLAALSLQKLSCKPKSLTQTNFWLAHWLTMDFAIAKCGDAWFPTGNAPLFDLDDCGDVARLQNPAKSYLNTLSFASVAFPWYFFSRGPYGVLALSTILTCWPQDLIGLVSLAILALYENVESWLVSWLLMIVSFESCHVPFVPQSCRI